MIAPAFEKVYSTTESILIMFPKQVLLTQRRPKIEHRIDHLKEIGSQYEFPEGTYAYTTVDEQTYLFSKPVSIESFWLRLHQPGQAYKQEEVGTRYIKVYNGKKLVQHTIINLWSDEWYLLTPSPSHQVIGDRLVI